MDGGCLFDLSTFVFSIVLFIDKHPRPILLSASRASPVYFYGGYARGYCSGLLLGLRSANEWKHGATRSAVASEQRSAVASEQRSAVASEHFYGGYARSLFSLLSGAGNSVT